MTGRTAPAICVGGSCPPGQNPDHRSPYDQCTGGNRRGETKFSAGITAAALSDSRGWLFRMASEWYDQNAYVHRAPRHQLFAFAGLWDTWHDPTGAALSTCTILTTTSNAVLAPIHHRMPVILPPEAETTWLDSHVTAPAALLPFLTPYASERMQAYAVSQAVNSPQHNTSDCIAPSEVSRQPGAATEGGRWLRFP